MVCHTVIHWLFFVKDTGVPSVLHYAEVQIAHQQGRGKPAQGQKHREYKALDQDTHVYDKRYIVPFVEKIEVEGLQYMFLAPGHHRRVYEVEHTQRQDHKGQCPAEIVSEVPVLEIYQYN